MEKPQTDKSQPKTAPKPVQQQKPQDFKHLVRIANTDLDGSKNIVDTMRTIKGVSFMYAHAICTVTHIPRTKKTSDLNENDIGKIESVLENPDKFSIPVWMLNRRKEYETGQDMHLITADLTFMVDNDMKRMKKIKSYKGVRHMIGQPVRGQRTKSNFRKNKGKISLGVIRKKTAPAPTDDKKK